MIKYYKYKDGSTIREKPSGLTVREPLSNGQFLTMWFWRERPSDYDGPVNAIWSVAIYIGTKKGAALWKRGKLPEKQTGECGLEGLRVALGNVLALANNIGWREEFQIKWADEKRRRAYRWLLRYPGFYEHKEDDALTFRRMEYWGREDDKGDNEI